VGEPAAPAPGQPDSETETGPSGARSWDRHRLVLSLRHALPTGTRLDCGDFLFGRRSWIGVTLPKGDVFALEVSGRQPDLADWERRKAEFAAIDLPFFCIFTGRQVPHAVGGADTGRIITTALKPAHDAAARAFPVDRAHLAVARHYRLDPVREVHGPPRSLYFFRPGQKPDEVGTLAILRGLIPDPFEVHSWYGRVLTAPMNDNGAGPLRFSLRHGLYTQADILTMRQYRELRARSRPRPTPTAPPPPPPPPPTPSAQAVRCKVCGILTDDWVEKQGSEGTCRACSYRKAGLEPVFCHGCGSAEPHANLLQNGLYLTCRSRKG